MNIVVKKIRDLTDKEYQDCLHLNLGSVGQMKHYFQQHYLGYKWAVCHMMYSNDVLVGWAFVFKKYRGISAFFYVDKEHRRQGIGRELSRSVRKRHRRYEVDPWDETSTDFFNAVCPRQPRNGWR